MVCTKSHNLFLAPAITTKSVFFYYFWGDRISSGGPNQLNIQDINTQTKVKMEYFLLLFLTEATRGCVTQQLYLIR